MNLRQIGIAMLTFAPASAIAAAAIDYAALFDKAMTTLLKYPSGKKEKTYTVPNGVKTIGWDAFGYNLFVREIRLPDSVTLIDDYAFAACTADGFIDITATTVIGGND